MYEYQSSQLKLKFIDKENLVTYLWFLRFRFNTNLL